MSLNTKEKPKKGKKDKKKSEEPIPDSLQNAPEPQPEEKIEPPRPIAFQESKGDVPRPTRLPPRFKERFRPSTQQKQQQESQTKPDQLVAQEQPQEENKQPTTTKSTKIQPPVSIRHRKSSIPKSEQEKEKEKVQPTRIELEEPADGQVHPTKEQRGRTLEDLVTSAQEDPLLKQFNCDNIIKRPKEESWPWKTARIVKIPSELESYWRIEASLYSAISMLHFFTIAYEKGDLAQEVYSKQLKSHLLEAIQLRFKLEKDKKFNWDEFVKENDLLELFSEGIEKLARVTGSSDIDAALDEETVKIDYHEMKKLPTKAADYVGNAIELMDLIRLQSVATVERLIPLLEDMKKLIVSSKIFDIDYWAIKEMDMWTEKLYHMKPGTIPSDEELERFEMYVVRWLNDFRRELKNI